MKNSRIILVCFGLAVSVLIGCGLLPFLAITSSCASDADCCAAVDCNAEADNTVRAGCCDPLCFRTCLDGECVTACESDE